MPQGVPQVESSSTSNVQLQPLIVSNFHEEQTGDKERSKELQEIGIWTHDRSWVLVCERTAGCWTLSKRGLGEDCSVNWCHSYAVAGGPYSSKL